MKNRSDELMKEIRSQLNQVMSELDKAADRNITVLESRIDELRIVVTQADKRLRLFSHQKENDIKHKKHYSELKQKAILQPDLFGAAKAVTMGGVVKTTAILKESKKSSLDIDLNQKSADVNSSVTKVVNDQELKDKKAIEIEPVNKELTHKEKRAQVVNLFGMGQSVKDISETLDVTMGEVELIISLRTKKNRGMPGR